MDSTTDLTSIPVGERMLRAARNATGTCLSAKPSDRAVIIYDASTREIAAALLKGFAEIGTTVQSFDFDTFGARPQRHPPGIVLRALEGATVSAMAITTIRGENTMRRAILDTVTKLGLRHAHMPAITKEVFESGLEMDYRQVAHFIDHLVDIVIETTCLTAKSAAGTDIEFRYESPPPFQKLNGLITEQRWQNLPSGQLTILPTFAEGIYIVDQLIGDWFEHEYEVTDYPVTLEFERGHVRSLKSENKRLERDLGLFLRSSENSGRISELVIGANYWLTKHSDSALFHNYRPSTSLSLGSTIPRLFGPDWSSATFLPLMAKEISLYAGARCILDKDVFPNDLLSHITP